MLHALLRIYFAARAPLEPASWFRAPDLPPFKHAPLPQPGDLAHDDHKGIARSWIGDPCFDLPEELEWFGEKYSAYWEAVRAYKRLMEQHAYIAWRWAYADAMVKGMRS